MEETHEMPHRLKHAPMPPLEDEPVFVNHGFWSGRLPLLAYLLSLVAVLALTLYLATYRHDRFHQESDWLPPNEHIVAVTVDSWDPLSGMRLSTYVLSEGTECSLPGRPPRQLNDLQRQKRQRLWSIMTRHDIRNVKPDRGGGPIVVDQTSFTLSIVLSSWKQISVRYAGESSNGNINLIRRAFDEAESAGLAGHGVFPSADVCTVSLH